MLPDRYEDEAVLSHETRKSCRRHSTRKDNGQLTIFQAIEQRYQVW